jgi:hypothetical protein
MQIYTSTHILLTANNSCCTAREALIAARPLLQLAPMQHVTNCAVATIDDDHCRWGLLLWVETLIYTCQLVITAVAVLNSCQDQGSTTHNGAVNYRYVLLLSLLPDTIITSAVLLLLIWRGITADYGSSCWKGLLDHYSTLLHCSSELLLAAVLLNSCSCCS